MAYNCRGISYNALGMHDKALEDYKRCIALDPKNATYYYNAGYSYMHLKQYAKALQYFDKSMEMKQVFRSYSAIQKCEQIVFRRLKWD